MILYTAAKRAFPKCTPHLSIHHPKSSSAFSPVGLKSKTFQGLCPMSLVICPVPATLSHPNGLTRFDSQPFSLLGLLEQPRLIPLSQATGFTSSPSLLCSLLLITEVPAQMSALSEVSPHNPTALPLSHITLVNIPHHTNQLKCDLFRPFWSLTHLCTENFMSTGISGTLTIKNPTQSPRPSTQWSLSKHLLNECCINFLSPYVASSK